MRTDRRRSAAGPRPSRRFGQNFLADPRLAASLVDSFDPQPGDTVVEIGPGQGALTRWLAPRAGRFVALEIDDRLIPGLDGLLAPFPNASVRRADALDVDWDALAAETGSRLRVIGNLPYNVGTAILRRLLASPAVRDIQVVLQLEVAERILASPGVKDYGPLSIVTALRCRRERIRVLSPGCFRPRPKVTSCALRLVALEPAPLLAAEVDAVEAWLFAGFAQRRKTLANNIDAERSLIRGFLEERGLPPDARAEAVPAADWLDLARRLSGTS
jgi:16S rRNA (adenine1518-N6/adenine1519-N6)-dimethyltransferase